MNAKPGHTPPQDHEPEERTSSEAESPGHGHDAMLRKMRAPWLWTNATLILLGLWLVSSPWTFGYESAAMTWSDVISGVLMAALAGAAFIPRYDFYGRWGVALLGTWLQFAPLLFWAPTAAAYLNDTLVGAVAITLSILVPMMPGMAHHMAMMHPGPEVPPGWSYNPSTWHQRAPMIGLAAVGWLLSRYLAAYQLGYIDRIWEPFFGEGTVRVPRSEMSKMWPISDAGLGATAYTFELLMAWMGGKTRWRTMPWMVTFFFILVVPLGVTHVVLVISQPVIVGEWCTICLAAAAVMLIMIPFTIDEVVAMGQFMVDRVRAGKPFWWTFFVGDTTEGGAPDRRTPWYGSPLRAQVPAAAALLRRERPGRWAGWRAHGPVLQDAHSPKRNQADPIRVQQLTGPVRGRRMGEVPKVRRSIGVALMMALVVSIGAQCVVGEEMTATQMACCVGTDHDCGTAAAAPECCQSEGAATEQLAAKIQQVVFPPAPMTSAVADLITPPDTHTIRGFEVDRTPLIAASPPKYVLLAAFLI